MAWLRGGDTAPTHPVALAILGHPDGDERLLNELFGFVTRCAMASTAHNIEYRITRGTAVLMAGGHARAEKLIEYALWAGYFTEVDGSDGTEFELLQDAEFIHLIPWDEREWKKQRHRDRNNKALVWPVRVRDGDACRYCGRVVQWGDNKAGLGGTYDHLHPGQPATIDTYVVCCKGCNAKFGDMPFEEKRHELMPAPVEAFYSQHTIDQMTNDRWVINTGFEVPKPTKRRLSPGALAVRNKQTSAGSQPAKADGPRGHSTEHTPASASDAGPLGSGEDRPSSSDPAASDTPQPGPRDTTGLQSEQDPAGTTVRSEGLSGGQPERDPAGTTVRSEGLSGGQPERDPANAHSSGPRDTTGLQSEQDPAEHHPEDVPKRAAPAPLTRPSPGETQYRAETARLLPDSCGVLPDSARSGDSHVAQIRDGSGRDGPGQGRVESVSGLAGPGRAGLCRERAGTGRERASSSPDASLPRRRRRKR